MRPRKPHAKSEIGRRPDSRIEVGVLGHTDIVNNLATGKKAPREAFFGALYRNITPWVWSPPPPDLSKKFGER